MLRFQTQYKAVFKYSLPGTDHITEAK